MVPSRSRLVAVWLTLAVAFGALLFVAQAVESGLGDPDPARQRPGFLDADSLPQPAPLLTASRPRAGHRTVAFFVGSEQFGPLCRALSAGDLATRADLVVVVAGSSGRCAAAAVVDDPSGRLARLYGIRQPKSGGPRVGYAVADRHGNIRYRTLDPSVADGLAEVATIVRATP